MTSHAKCSLSIVAFALFSIHGFAQNVASSAAPPVKGEPHGGQEIQNYLDSLAADNKLSGAILVAKDGVPIASKAAGIANKATNADIRLETKFNLGSMNKMFTGVAIAQLVQSGRLSFDDSIRKHLPDYPNRDVADKVTIHQLLTHTSGLGSYPIDAFKAQREKLTTVTSYFPLFVNEPLSFAPGEKFQYSNAGFLILGAIIEKVSGQDYYSYVRDHIYKPAGMLNTGFYEPGKEIPNLAIGYTRMGPDGRPGSELTPNTDRLEVRGGPAGGGFSTVEDLLKFHMALSSFKLLNREYTELVTKGKVDGGGPGNRYAYGFGDSVVEGRHIVGHNGGWPGVAANFDMFPELGYTAVILMNMDPPAMKPVVTQLRQLIPAK